MNIETITLLTIFIPIIGSFTVLLAGLFSRSARSAWTVLLGATSAMFIVRRFRIRVLIS